VAVRRGGAGHRARGQARGDHRLGAEIHQVPFAARWDVLVTRQHPRFAGAAVHPSVCDRAVVRGNGTIGLEILEALPAPPMRDPPVRRRRAHTGIAAACRAATPRDPDLHRRPETRRPMPPRSAAGRRADVAYAPSFVDGIGSRSLLPSVADRPVAGHGGSPLPLATSPARSLLAERNRVIPRGRATPVAARWPGARAAARSSGVVSAAGTSIGKLGPVLGGELP